MISRRAFVVSSLALTVAACDTGAPVRLGTDGKPLPSLYTIKPGDEAAIQYRMLDSVNALRKTAGARPLQLNAQLNAAAATHSRDMSVQNRAWHFGSDGSSPLDRVKRTGYPLTMRGENLSETYETELETLSAWMAQADTRNVVLDPTASAMGFSWFQEPNGKIWWTMVTGG